MTLSEFAIETAELIRSSYNLKNRAGVLEALRRAESTLAASNLTADDTKRFWSLVRQRLNSGQLLVERQEQSALHDLMKEIEAAIAAGESGQKK